MDFLKKFIGDKKFYKMLLAIAIPIMIQNGITNLVNMVDNIMVGKLGTEQMSGVAIVNQLLFVFNLCVFGAIAGAGIFSSQFHGKKDNQGVKYALRYKIIICIILAIIGILLLGVFDTEFVSLYLHEGTGSGNIEVTLSYAKEYIAIMLIGLVPFAIKEAYAGTLRETEETIVPMIAGIVAILVNLTFNYLLIFGNLGFPNLGVAGAAIATVLSRFVEMVIVVVWTHTNRERNPFIIDLYRGFEIPKSLLKDITIKGMPLLANEALWAGGVATITQCYSLRGLDIIAAQNISNTISNVFGVVFIALGSSIGIIIGNMLGAGKTEEAKKSVPKLMAFAVVSCILVGIIMLVIAPTFPDIYETQQQIKDMAKNFIMVYAAFMPFYAFTNGSYFTLRSGGKTIITFLFDSISMWCINIPLVYYLSKHTSVDILIVYLACQSVEIIKSVIGYIFLKKGIWIHNIVNTEAEE